MKRQALGLLGGGILLFLLVAGCAGSRTYLLKLQYDPAGVPSGVQNAPRPVNLAVYNFRDVRPERLHLGRRLYRDGMVDFFKPDSGTVEEVVTQSMIRLLEKAGFKVTRVNRYLDPAKEDFRNIPGDGAFGGSIESLWVEAKTGVGTTDTVASIRLILNWGLVKDRTWITKTIEGQAQETNRPFYQVRHAEAKINEVFKDGLDKILKNEPLLEKLVPAK